MEKLDGVKKIKSSGRKVEKTNKSMGNLIKLLPTGTVFMFQFLDPIFTNNGHCRRTNRHLTAVLVTVSAFSCAFSCFTDSYRGTDGRVHYGLVTASGLWPHLFSGDIDMSQYRLKLADFVHAVCSVIVFAVITLLDSNTVRCFYPEFMSSSQKVLLKILPPAVGFVTAIVFMAFPNKRHGFGYPESSNDYKQPPKIISDNVIQHDNEPSSST